MKRQVHFARSAIQLEFESGRPTHLVDFLFGSIADSGPAQPHRTYRLTDSTEGELQLFADGEPAYRYHHLAEMGDWLLGDAGYHLADRSRGGLLFHAAALSQGKIGLVLPGTMGAGKTTLTAWLLSRGFDYLSDELTFVPNQTHTVHGLARPLNLKRPSRPALEEFLDFSAPSPLILSTQHNDLILPVALRPGNQLSQPALRLIIFPRYQAGSALQLQPLSQAQSAKGLMECLVNARNLPEHGFKHITQLARQASAYRLTYSDFSQLAAAIETSAIFSW